MTLIIILSFLAVFAIGLITLVRRRNSLFEKREFTNHYRNEFVKFANRYNGEGVIDTERHTWLTLNSNRAQSIIGVHGVMEYIMPFNRGLISNYQVILNTLPMFHTGMAKAFDVNAVADALLRYIGVADHKLEEQAKRLRNPFIWFAEGMRQVLSFPVRLLYWFDIISKDAVERTTANMFFRIVAGVVAFAAFASSIVTIIQGWDQTLALVKGLFYKSQ